MVFSTHMSEVQRTPATDKPLTLTQAALAGGAVGALGGLWLADFTLIGPVRTVKQDFARVTKVTAGAALVGAAAVLLLGALARGGKRTVGEGCVPVDGDRGTTEAGAAWTGREDQKQAADALAAKGAAPSR